MIFAFAAALAFCPTDTAAQTAKAIKFARGATSTVISGKMTGYQQPQVFTIKVNAGQKMSLAQLAAGNRRVSIYVEGPDGEPALDYDLSCHSKGTVEPTVAGVYKITVTECEKADPWSGNWRVRVTVN